MGGIIKIDFTDKQRKELEDGYRSGKINASELIAK